TMEDGDREFSFYRNPGADMALEEADLDEELIRNSRIFHYGSLSMTHEGCRLATRKAVDIAEKSGAVLSFDPNLRESLWGSLDEAREQILYGMAHCQILKISDNEIQWLTGEVDFDKGIEWIRERFSIPLILLSMGKEGSRAYVEGKRVQQEAFVQEKTVETTGAGDTFCGCILNYVLDVFLAAEWPEEAEKSRQLFAEKCRECTEEQLREMLRFANAAASIITTRKGALRVMPTREEVEAFLNGI
ncbi:MAG: carbohydrate kinase, partial [Lachnospiraceae bacterium]|nr:carbohydrate kinase [Lachnospiraceae bacterium]